MENCSLELEVSKSECFSWSGELPAAAPQDIRLAGEQVDGRWEPGWVVYGCPMGTDAYVSFMLDKKVEELAEGAERACEVLEGESQALWAVLRLSLQQQFLSSQERNKFALLWQTWQGQRTIHSTGGNLF